jgi:hypothetical protein
MINPGPAYGLTTQCFVKGFVFAVFDEHEVISALV